MKKKQINWTKWNKTAGRKTEISDSLQVKKIYYSLFYCTFVTCFQLNLSTVAPIPPISPSPDPEHIGGPRFEPFHCHHVGASLQNCIVLFSLVLERKKKVKQRVKKERNLK